MIFAVCALAAVGLCWSIRYGEYESVEVDSNDTHPYDRKAKIYEIYGKLTKGERIPTFREDEPWSNSRVMQNYYQKLISLGEYRTGNCQDFLPRTTLIHDGIENMVSEPTMAMYAVLVNTSDHYKKQDMVEDGLAMFRSLGYAGSSLPMHLIAANLAEEAKRKFTDMGVTVHDMTQSIPEVKSWYAPIYNRSEAEKLKRHWVDKNFVQDRVDGWACYFKFFAWKAPYDVVLLADLDVKFATGTNVDSMVKAAAQQGRSFVTCHEGHGREYNGIISHKMILRPSSKTFRDLVKKASTGDYVPFTNGEQEILECYFRAPSSVLQDGFSELCPENRF